MKRPVYHIEVRVHDVADSGIFVPRKHPDGDHDLVLEAYADPENIEETSRKLAAELLRVAPR